jgi:antitoxin (DNA-binding transcriptional repressor) of toxin-antitoxin stability system
MPRFRSLKNAGSGTGPAKEACPRGPADKAPGEEAGLVTVDIASDVATMATRATRSDAMSMVGIRELKNQLTRYLRRVKQGEEIVVTERGRPVAVIHRIRCDDPVASLEARLAGLALEGLVTLPTSKPLKKVRSIKVKGPAISKSILEDRR